MTTTSNACLVLTERKNWFKEIEPWAREQIRRNLWRFDPVNDIDDVLQEVRILFLKLLNKYPTITEPKHFAAILRTSVSRFFIDKSREKRRSISTPLSIDDIIEGEVPESNLQNFGQVALLLDGMPTELKNVLDHLTTSRVRLKLDRPTKKFLPRENHNMRLRRKLGLSSIDPVGDLKAYFTQG